MQVKRQINIPQIEKNQVGQPQDKMETLETGNHFAEMIK
jgi:hypothetical protein